MITIHVDGERRAHKQPLSGVFICDNKDRPVQITVDQDSGFDLSQETWAVFTTSKAIPQEVAFTGNIVIAPPFTKEDGRFVYVGIYQGDIRTSTAASVTLLESIKSKALYDSYIYDGVVENSSELDAQDVVQVSSLSLGKLIKVRLSALAQKIKGLIGTFTGTSDGLVPAPGVDVETGLPNPNFILHADGTWGESSPGTFYAEVGVTLFEDILAAKEAGKTIIAFDVEKADVFRYYPLLQCDSQKAYFSVKVDEWVYNIWVDERGWDQREPENTKDVFWVQYNSTYADDITDALAAGRECILEWLDIREGITYYAPLDEYGAEYFTFSNGSIKFILEYDSRRDAWDWTKVSVSYDYVPIYAGIENAGKFVTVDDDGFIQYTELSEWNGGDY